jgi:hypothetical protein
LPFVPISFSTHAQKGETRISGGTMSIGNASGNPKLSLMDWNDATMPLLMGDSHRSQVDLTVIAALLEGTNGWRARTKRGALMFDDRFLHGRDEATG